MTTDSNSDPSSPGDSSDASTDPAAATSSPTPDQPPRKPKIQIGSQRDAADVSLQPSQPKAVQQAKSRPVEIVPREEVKDEEPVPIGSPEGLGDDIESEIDAALADVSMDAVLDKLSPVDEELELNSRVKASVSRVHGDNVFVSLKGRFEGVLPLAQFKSPPTDGQMIEVVVKNLNEEDGLYEVAIPGSAVAVADWEDLNEGDLIEARVSGSNTGGLEVMVNSIRGFIPASQIDRFRVENFGDYVNQKLQCLVTEVNPQKRKLVLSRRAILEREREEQRKALLASLAEGDAYEGVVTKLMDFGAFVDIGGTEGLVHISKLSWDRVTHPKEVVSEGERVKVKVEKVNRETGKISLSIRDTLEHPWDNIGTKYTVQETVPGTVTKIADFGAFVRLEPGIEGLVHISEIAHHRVVRISNYLKQGDQVEVKILSIDPEKQKLGLSIKANQAAPVKVEKTSEDEADEPLRESAVPPSQQPLRGGTDRKTGGEDIGLNW